MSRPATTVSGIYDLYLQAALRHFFERAVLEAEPAGEIAGDAMPPVEPSHDRLALTVRWFGTRYTLRVSDRWPFTSHEVRLARAIVAVLAARYRAITEPQLMTARSDLMRGSIDDRYIGAFLDPAAYAPGTLHGTDRTLDAIELLRVAALSSYENRPISTGVLLLGETSSATYAPEGRAVPADGHSLAAVKSAYRLADGVRTVFLATADGRLRDVVDVGAWARDNAGARRLEVPCARTYEAHARATLVPDSICVVLSPSREIKVFAEGVQVFGFRGASWHLLDVEAKFELWVEAVGNRRLAARLFQAALDLADARQGALFAVVRDPARAVRELVAPADRLDLDLAAAPQEDSRVPSRRDLLRLLGGRRVTRLAPSILEALASLDGATVVDRRGRLLAAAAILRHPPALELGPAGLVEGARTTAALAASRFGPVLKISSDGVMTFFDDGRIWDI